MSKFSFILGTKKKKISAYVIEVNTKKQSPTLILQILSNCWFEKAFPLWWFYGNMRPRDPFSCLLILPWSTGANSTLWSWYQTPGVPRTEERSEDCPQIASTFADSEVRVQKVPLPAATDAGDVWMILAGQPPTGSAFQEGGARGWRVWRFKEFSSVFT